MDSWMQVHLLSKLARRENAVFYERGGVTNVGKGRQSEKAINIVALLKERTCRERQRLRGQLRERFSSPWASATQKSWKRQVQYSYDSGDSISPSVK